MISLFALLATTLASAAAGCPDFRGKYECFKTNTQDPAPSFRIDRVGETYWQRSWPMDLPFKPNGVVEDVILTHNAEGKETSRTVIKVRTTCVEAVAIVGISIGGKSGQSVYRKTADGLELSSEGTYSRTCRRVGP